MKVKLYLPNDHIRRFNIKDNLSFDEIYQTVVDSIIGPLAPFSYVMVQYLDESIEWITVLTQEEWDEAQNCILCRDGVILLRARVEQDKQKKKDQKKQAKKNKKKNKKQKKQKKKKQQQEQEQRSSDLPSEASNSSSTTDIPAVPSASIESDPQFRQRMDDALSLISRNRLTDAVDALVSLRRDFPTHSLVYYNLACVYSLQGRPQDAVGHLRSAVALGYRDWNWMLKDPDLEAVRNDAECMTKVEGLVQHLQSHGDLVYTIDLSPDGSCQMYEGLPHMEHNGTGNRTDDEPTGERDARDTSPRREERPSESPELGNEHAMGRENETNSGGDETETDNDDDESDNENDNENDNEKESSNPNTLEQENTTKDNDVIENQFRDQLNLLNEMGFSNTEENTRLLDKCNGDVARVLAHLVNTTDN